MDRKLCVAGDLKVRNAGIGWMGRFVRLLIYRGIISMENGFNSIGKVTWNVIKINYLLLNNRTFP